MFIVSLLALALAVMVSAGTVGVDIQRRLDVDIVPHGRVRAGRSQILQTLDNQYTLYLANITIGTPPQMLRMLLDTGSSDLWCNSVQSSFCKDPTIDCTASGTYNSSTSSTFTFLNDAFAVNYADNTGASGDYVTDSIGIGGQTIANFQFGVGIRSRSTMGVLGIGYALRKAQTNVDQQSPYANLPQSLVENGLINSNAYSLWLNNVKANTGQILFGGVNTEKYHGCLQTVPISPNWRKYTAIQISLEQILVDKIKIYSTRLPVVAVLDSGSTLTSLPNDVADSIYRQLGAVVDRRWGPPRGYAPCSLAELDKSIDFFFNGVKISVPYGEMVTPLVKPGGSMTRTPHGKPMCDFGIVPSDNLPIVLGDSFLRSAYVVVDLDNNEVSLAQTNANSTTDNIMEIQAGPHGVPNATRAVAPFPDREWKLSQAVKLAFMSNTIARFVAGSPAKAVIAVLIGSVVIAMGSDFLSE